MFDKRLAETELAEPARRKRKQGEGGDLKSIRLFCIAVALVSMAGSGTVCVRAQEASPALAPSQEALVETNDVSLPSQDPPQAGQATTKPSSEPDAPAPKTDSADTNVVNSPPGNQPRRILWIIPNYRAVRANTYLPPLSVKEKFWLATEDTFDYSDFILVGGLAGISLGQNSQPSFGQGAAGYGRYYWHIFVDGAVENYMTEAILPTLTKEDPRYYTLGKGGFVKRTGYAISRLFVTRTDAGKNTFYMSEFVGAGAAAGIGNLYYPPQSNPWVKTYQRWGTQLALDAVFNVLKEFWPDIDQKVFHGKY